MKCHYCHRDLEIGEDAFIQEVKFIEVIGTRVTEEIREVVVCVDCANKRVLI